MCRRGRRDKAPSTPHPPGHIPEDKWAPTRDGTAASGVHGKRGRQASWHRGSRRSVPKSVDSGEAWLHHNDLTSPSKQRLLREAFHPPCPGRVSTAPAPAGRLGALCSSSSSLDGRPWDPCQQHLSPVTQPRPRPPQAGLPLAYGGVRRPEPQSRGTWLYAERVQVA